MKRSVESVKYTVVTSGEPEAMPVPPCGSGWVVAQLRSLICATHPLLRLVLTWRIVHTDFEVNCWRV